MRFGEAAALALLLAACDGDVKGDFDNICNAAERSGAMSEADTTARAVKIAQWLQPQVKTEKARKFMAELAMLDPKKKGQALRGEAKKHGVSPCPIADVTWPGER